MPEITFRKKLSFWFTVLSISVYDPSNAIILRPVGKAEKAGNMCQSKLPSSTRPGLLKVLLKVPVLPRLRTKSLTRKSLGEPKRQARALLKVGHTDQVPQKTQLVVSSAPDLLTRVWILTTFPDESQHSIIEGKSLHSSVIDVLCQVTDCSWLATCLVLRYEIPGKAVRNF